MIKHLYTDEQLVNCYIKHESQIKAAEELGVSRETVARAVRRQGIKLFGCKNNGKNQPQKKVSDDELIEAAKSLSCAEISQKYPISSMRAYKRLHKLGIKVESCSSRWEGRAKQYHCMSGFDRSITLKKVCDKYHGVCQICGGLISWDDIKNGYIGRLYPTVDHIIPLSKGGLHTWDNVQLAHMACNAGKRDKVENAAVMEG